MDAMERGVIATIALVLTFAIGVLMGVAMAERAAHNSGYNECLLKHVVKENEK